MRALILAAGYATRLYPLTKDRPKPLLPVGGRALLDYLFDQLEQLPDLSGVALVTNHRFVDHFRAWAAARSSRVPLEVLDDGTDSPDNRLGAIGDVAWALRETGVAEHHLVAAADNLFPPILQGLCDLAARRASDCISCYPLEDTDRLRRTGIVAIAADGRVLRFEEKPREPWSNLSVPPIYFYRRETLPLFEEYLQHGNNPDAPGHFVPWLLTRRPVYAYQFSGPVIDIGTPESYAAACRAVEAAGGLFTYYIPPRTHSAENRF